MSDRKPVADAIRSRSQNVADLDLDLDVGGNSPTTPPSSTSTRADGVDQPTSPRPLRDRATIAADQVKLAHGDRFDRSFAATKLAGDLPAALALIERLAGGLLAAEHRLRLLADQTYDYGPEGMRTRLLHNARIVASEAEIARPWIGDRL